MARQQRVALYDNPGGDGFVVRGTVPPVPGGEQYDVILYDGRTFVYDNVTEADGTRRYRAAWTYAMTDVAVSK